MRNLISLDKARELNPELAFGVYALEPLGPVTLEIITPDGEVFSFQGLTEADALAKAFPETGIPITETTEAEPSASIFD